MISKNKMAGFSEIYMLLSIIFFFSIMSYLLMSQKGTPSDMSETKTSVATVEVKHEILQPVVTEFKSYSNETYVSNSKLTPVLNPEMRKDPILPVAPVEKVETPVPAPIIEKNENHYHFEDLNSGITYLASSLLGIFTAFCLYKGFGRISQNISVKRAIKKSTILLKSFEADINNTSTYLDYTRVITDQLRFNNTIMEQNKNSYHIASLSVVNDKLVANLNFAESSLVKDMR